MVAVGAQALIPDARPAGEGVLRRGCVCGSRVKCTHLFNIRKAAAKVIRIFNSCRGLCGRKGSDNVWMPALGGTVSIVSLKMSAPQTIFQNHYPSHVANLLPMVILSLHPLRFYMLPPPWDCHTPE